MPDTPTPDAEKTLLESLALVVEALGREAFLTAPIVLADAEHFPDPWHADERGPRRLMKRLLRYAGLPDMRVEVVVAEDEIQVGHRASVGGIGTTHSFTGPSAWVVEWREGAPLVGVAVRLLEDPDQMVGVLAREAARLRLMNEKLIPDDPESIEAWVDLTAIALGLGVLTTNASHRVRTSLKWKEGGAVQEQSYETVGSLSPYEHCFVLAFQLLARRASPAERQRVEKALLRSQAAAFRSAEEKLKPQLNEWLERFRIQSWIQPPATRSLQAYLAPLDGEQDPVDVSRHPSHPREERPNAGELAFRGTARQTWLFGAFGCFAGVMALIFGPPLPVLGVWLVLACTAAGMMLGRFRRTYSCLASGCGAVLRPEGDACPVCGAKIIGALPPGQDRDAALRAWKAAHAPELRADDESLETLALSANQEP